MDFPSCVIHIIYHVWVIFWVAGGTVSRNSISLYCRAFGRIFKSELQRVCEIFSELQRSKNCSKLTTLPETNILLMEEILHQLLRSLYRYLQGFIHPRWCRISSINSSSPWKWIVGRLFLPSFWCNLGLIFRDCSNSGAVWIDDSFIMVMLAYRFDITNNLKSGMTWVVCLPCLVTVEKRVGEQKYMGNHPQNP